jgi:hypothetical protein
VHRLFFVLLLVGCPGPGPGPGPTPPAAVTETALPPCVSPQAPGFDDGLAATGLDFISETLPNDEVSGVVVADFDGDGLADIILGQLDGPLSFFWNDNGSFTRVDFDLGEDRTFYAGTAVDYDGDDRLDLLVSGPDTVILLRNDGLREFVLDHEIDIGDHMSTGGTFGDYDGDGDLDLYLQLGQDDFQPGGVPPDSPPGTPPDLSGEINDLYRNDGDSFVAVEDRPAVSPAITHHARWEDFDFDGDPDLLVLNDFGFDGYQSELWENLGNGWLDHGMEAMGALVAPMGALVEDLDRDGHADMWITEVGPTRLFQGGGDFSFVDVSLTWIDPAEHRPDDVSWSMIPVDVDGDGYPEVFASYGGLPNWEINGGPSIIDQPNRLFRSVDGVFANDPSLLPDLPARNSRGAARGDLNGDGWPDLVVRNINGPPDVLLGRCQDVSRAVVRLRDTTARNRFAIGASVRIGDQVRTVEAGGLGTGAGSGPELYFGLADATTVDIEVTWPGGETTVYSDLCADCDLLIER